MARILLLLLATLALANPVQAQARQVALVIANSEYKATTSLANPENDATLVSRALQEAGFDTVELGHNLTQDDMLARMREFREQARGAETALLYFAGHGIEGASEVDRRRAEARGRLALRGG